MARYQFKGGDVLTPKVIVNAEESSVTELLKEIGTAGVAGAFITQEGKSGGIVTDRGMTSSVIERQSNKSLFMRNFEHVIKWLCGLWAFGLGFRFTIELLASEGWIHMPKHPLNIWFDFFPLCILGFLVVVFEVRNLISIAYAGKPASEDLMQA
jgi:hypothetical protein